MTSLPSSSNRDDQIAAQRDEIVRGYIHGVTGDRVGERVKALAALDALLAERDRYREALVSAQEYVLHLHRDAVGDEAHLDDSGEPYHADDCDTCRETRLLRKIAAALETA